MALFNVAAGLAGLAFAVGLFVVALVFALSSGYRTRRERPGGSRYGLTGHSPDARRDRGDGRPPAFPWQKK